jgi:tetraprenyl-beta-curcumene synthase
MRSPHRPQVGDTLALLKTGITYWMRLAPTARRELRCWWPRAQAMPDPLLRRASIEKLSGEGLNSEAAALFAILAPRSARRRLVALIVAYQVMYDYLDAVNEEPASSQLLDGQHLHQALVHAVHVDVGEFDYYAHHPRWDDGGYLRSLVEACNSIYAVLPATAATAEPLIEAATLCGEAQARNHAIAADGYQSLVDWSTSLAPPGPYHWWELAAAGISCLAIHALLATAATPETAQDEAVLVRSAYFPAITAISALLDSLIDREHDQSTDNHSFATHYNTDEAAVDRYAAIITEAMTAIEQLPQNRAHQIILAGIVTYYTSAVPTGDTLGQLVTSEAKKSLRPTVWPIHMVMRARASLHKRSPCNRHTTP